MLKKHKKTVVSLAGIVSRWNLRALAGLGQCSLQVDDLAQALHDVEELLPILETQGHGGGMNVYETILLCYEILNATADQRANELLARGCRMLQAQAAHFDDASLRHAFLDQVAANRTLLQLWSTRHAQP